MKLKTKLMYKMTCTFDGKQNALSDNKRRKFYMLICWKASEEIIVVTKLIRELSQILKLG